MNPPSKEAMAAAEQAVSEIAFGWPENALDDLTPDQQRARDDLAEIIDRHFAQREVVGVFQRYDLVEMGHDYSRYQEMAKRDDGDWVSWDDHAALVSFLTAERDAVVQDSHSRRKVELEWQRRAELAEADNAAMRAELCKGNRTVEALRESIAACEVARVAAVEALQKIASRAERRKGALRQWIIYSSEMTAVDAALSLNAPFDEVKP